MRYYTVKLMAALEGRMNRFLRMHDRACGDGQMVEQANRRRDKLMRWLEWEIERLCEKAGEQ